MAIDQVQQLAIDTSFGWVDINGVAFDGSACFGCPDISFAYDGPAVRGSDRLLPGAPFVKPYPRRVTVTKRNMPVIIIGAKAPDGSPAPGAYEEQLQLNWDYLQVGVVLPPPGVTYTSTWHRPDGGTLTAQVVVETAPAVLQPGAQMKVVLGLSFPAGMYA